jgi:hypothetical protein
MPKLRSYKRITTSDFNPDFKEIVEGLGSTVNDSFGDIYFVLNGRADLANNISCTLRDVEITANASGTPINRTVFTVKNATLPVIGITVILALNLSNPSGYPTSQPFISFTQIDGGILINNITGLQPNQRYLIRLVAWN